MVGSRIVPGVRCKESYYLLGLTIVAGQIVTVIAPADYRGDRRLFRGDSRDQLVVIGYHLD